jgi:hypothetical protein
MIVVSQVVVGLASVKKGRSATCICTYNSILDFYVLIVNPPLSRPPP